MRGRGKEDGVLGEWKMVCPHCDDKAKFRRSECGFGNPLKKEQKMEVSRMESS